MRPDTPLSWLSRIEAFAGLGQPELRRLLSRCYTQTLPGRALLVARGDEARAVHILLSGRLIREAPGRELRETAPGDVVGENEFFARAAYAETVTAARESVALTLEWDEFAQLAARAPEYWQAAAVGFARKAALSGGERAGAPSPPPRTVALLAAGPGDARAHFEAMAAALEPLADCQILTSSSFGQNLPGGITLDDPEVRHWLQEQQQRFDLIVRIADPEWSRWTENAVAEADEILLVGVHDGRAGGPDVPLNPVEAQAMAARGAHACRLAIAHERRMQAGPLPGARRWLANRPVRAHHHVVKPLDGGYDRLARMLLGRSTAYVACSGGAFPLAHLGVLQALADSGATVDCVGGVGGGAVAAALIALGVGPDEAAALFPLPRSRSDFERLCQRLFGAAEIEDLALPFRALSIDLASGAARIHRSGSVAQALLPNWPPAGAAYPHHAPDGALLADGSLADPAPAWLLRDIHAGPVMLGRIEPPPLSPDAHWRSDSPSALDWALRRLPGLRAGETADPFDIADLMTRGLNLRAGPVALGPGDLMLAPRLPPGLRASDPEHQAAARDAAYRWTIDRLDPRAAAAHEETAEEIQAS